MPISYSLGSLLTIKQIQECTKTIASRTDTDTIWIPETWGMENFSMLSLVSQIATRPKIGSSIINIYSRSPATIAMGAATVDTISNGRLVLGLGISSMPIIQDFHGYELTKPIQRMKEYVEIIRLIISGNKIDYSGKLFRLKNFSLLIRPPRKIIPIYLAAVNKKMIDLTWEIADGVILYLRPKQEMSETVNKMQQKRRIDVACQLITAVSHDEEKARERARKTLSFYIAVGKIYREFLAENGFEKETSNILREFEENGLKNIHSLITDHMLDELTICGTPEVCKKQLQKFKNIGIDNPIIQFNPIDNVTNSFNLFLETFGENKL